LLTKSQARVFFLGGTGLFSAIFIALSVDSMRKIPAQTNDDQITDDVIAGKHIWEDNNCMGCHTLFGEGAYYAPELTKVVDRRGAPWIKMFMKDPEAMFPGQRKMVKYDFTDEEIDQVVAFLDWCGKVDLNGFPAEPPLRERFSAQLGSAPPVASATAKPQPEIFSTICKTCHAVEGQGGGIVGLDPPPPPLDEAHARYTRDQLRAWLVDPQKVKPGTTMPKIPMEPEQLDAVIDYLMSLGGK